MGSKNTSDFPVYVSAEDFTGKCDVIVDFSFHTATEGLLNYAVKNNLPIVIATTGHTEEETALIKKAAETVPVFYSRNMSLGINLLIALANKACKSLGSAFDIEIIEKHHNQKLDAPSGTALMIADALKDTRDIETEYIYNRQPVKQKRQKNEIGIHAVRGGTIVGEHEVIFAGKDEVITLSHSAASRDVFAEGAVRAAQFIVGKTPALYDMNDIVNSII
jgi:4-hydroxy-tetrahydrodipicolinate reductase